MKKFLNEEEGSVVVLVALLLPVLIGIMGLVIDGGNLLYHQTKLAEATEASGISSALMSYDKDLWETQNILELDETLVKENASKMLNKNFSKAEIEEIKIINKSGLRIETKVTVKFTFMQLFGFKEKKLKCIQEFVGG